MRWQAFDSVLICFDGHRYPQAAAILELAVESDIPLNKRTAGLYDQGFRRLLQHSLDQCFRQTERLFLWEIGVCTTAHEYSQTPACPFVSKVLVPVRLRHVLFGTVESPGAPFCYPVVVLDVAEDTAKALGK